VKDKLLADLIANGKNIIYPDTCTDFSNTKKVLSDLKSSGYSVVLLFIYASKSQCLLRGAGYDTATRWET